MTATIQVRERPILFSGPMVKAILAGRKTQTRRIVSRVSGFGSVRQFNVSITPGYDWQFRCRRGLWQDVRMEQLLGWCPYGQVGDRLWVRETWARSRNNWLYRADAGNGTKPSELVDDWDWDYSCCDIWRPSIHMPRRAARLFLEVTGVRVERLRDISESNAIAEGATEAVNPEYDPSDPGDNLPHSHKSVFAELWKKINGPESWDANPWVWVVEFQKTEGG